MSLSPKDIVNKRFKSTRLTEGYDMEEVDNFLDEIEAELDRLLGENESLTGKLGACEQRVAQLSRSTGQVAEPMPAEVPAVSATPGGEVDEVREAAGVLALAQRLHDEYVRKGQEDRDRMLAEARDRAGALVQEAEATRSGTLSALENERSGLERHIEELRSFEREHRSRLRSYLQDQLNDLDNQSVIVLPSETSGAVPLGQPGQ